MDTCPPTTVLVIDDAPSIVRVLTGLLRRAGYRVETAGNGRHALAHLQRQGFDVILSDLCMPELDGRTFYAVLQQQYPALRQRIIFLTAAFDDADTRAFLAQCGQPWLAKPFPFAALLRAMQQVLAGAPPVPPARGARRGASRSQGGANCRSGLPPAKAKYTPISAKQAKYNPGI